MALWRRGDVDSLTFRWQQTAMAAGDGEATRLASGAIAGKLQCSSGEDEGTKGGRPSTILPGWLIRHGRWHTGGAVG
jgi:hypothetical protein